ncbi:MAG: hypothetical protein RR140_03570 [Clostridia bacterium]
MKKLKLVATAVACFLILGVMVFGVYAATTTNVAISNQIRFTLQGEVLAEVRGAVLRKTASGYFAYEAEPNPMKNTSKTYKHNNSHASDFPAWAIGYTDFKNNNAQRTFCIRIIVQNVHPQVNMRLNLMGIARDSRPNPPFVVSATVANNLSSIKIAEELDLEAYGTVVALAPTGTSDLEKRTDKIPEMVINSGLNSVCIIMITYTLTVNLDDIQLTQNMGLTMTNIVD